MSSGFSKKIFNLSKHSFADIDAKNERRGRKLSNINTQAVIYNNEQLQQLFTGLYLDENLHNVGTYRWLSDYSSHKYEGKLFLNNLHGYGKFSYPNDALYEGLFYFNKKLGPGVITYNNQTQDVGIWNGNYLIRLCTKHSISDYYKEHIPKLSGLLESKLYLLQFKRLIPISEKFKDPAKKILTKLAAPDTVLANKSALYSTLVRNPNSMFINGEKLYKNFYTYEDELYTTIDVVDHYDENGDPVVVKLEVCNLVAWNNEEIYTGILRHAFLNRHYEKLLSYKVKDVLYTNKRGHFLPPGPIETRSEELLIACRSGDPKLIRSLITEYDLYPDVADCRGNNTVTYATLSNQTKNIKILSEFGANLNHFNDDCVTPLLFAILQYIATKNEVPCTLWESAFIYAKAENYLPACNQQWPVPSTTSLDQGSSEPSQKSDDQLSLTSKPSDSEFNIEKRLNDNKMTKNQERRPSFASLFTDYLFPLDCFRKRTINIRKTIDSKLFRKSFNNNGEVDVTYEQYKNEETNKYIQTISTLLLCGANPNVGEVPFCPIITAIFTKSKDVIQMLISFKVDVNAKTCELFGNLGPLHVIGSLRPSVEQLEMAFAFLENEANVDDLANNIHWLEEQSILLAGKVPEDQLGKTPLHLVCMRYDFCDDPSNCLIKLVLLFIQYGANLNLKYLGHSPLTLAMMRGNLTLMESLLETGLIDPNEGLGYNMGVPLTVCILNRYNKILHNNLVKQMYSILERFYANPFNDVENFNGNAIEFYYNEQSLAQISKRPSVTKANSGILLLQYAKTILLKYVQSKAVQILYHYKIICSFDSSLYTAVVKYLNYSRTLEIFQILIDQDKIIVNDLNMQKLLQLLDKKELNVNITFEKSDIYYPKFHFDNYMPETDPVESKYKVCFECFRKTDKILILCPKCEMVYFCSQECNLKNSNDPNSAHPCKGVFYNLEKNSRSSKRRITKLEYLGNKSIKLQRLLSSNDTDMEEFGKMDSKEKKLSIKKLKKNRKERKEKSSQETETTRTQERDTKETKSRENTGKTEASTINEKKKGKGDKPEDTTRTDHEKSRKKMTEVDDKKLKTVNSKVEKDESKLKKSSEVLVEKEKIPEDNIQGDNLKTAETKENQESQLLKAEYNDEQTSEIDKDKILQKEKEEKKALNKSKERKKSKSVEFTDRDSIIEISALKSGKLSKKTSGKNATKDLDVDEEPTKKKPVKDGKQSKNSRKESRSSSPEKQKDRKASRAASAEKQKERKASRFPSPEKEKDRKASRSPSLKKQKISKESRSPSPEKQKDRKASRAASAVKQKDRKPSRSPSPKKEKSFKESRSSSPEKQKDRKASRAASAVKQKDRKPSRSPSPEKQKDRKTSKSPSPKKEKSFRKSRSSSPEKQKDRETSRAANAGKRKSRKESTKTSTDFGENQYNKVNVNLKKKVLKGASAGKQGISIFFGSKKPVIDIEKRNMYCKLREQMLERDRALNARKADAVSEYPTEKLRIDKNCTKHMLQVAKQKFPNLTKNFEELDVKFWQMFSPYCIFQNGQLYYNFNEENNDVYYNLTYSCV